LKKLAALVEVELHDGKKCVSMMDALNASLSDLKSIYDKTMDYVNDNDVEPMPSLNMILSGRKNASVMTSDSFLQSKN
jgi:hypothetical protein